MENERKIVVPNFNGEGEHLYQDMLGWQENHKMETHSLVSREIFESFIVKCGLNLSFYYVDNDNYFGLHTERYPIELKFLPRDRTRNYIGWQCVGDTHDDGEVLFSFKERTMEIWDTIQIDGKSLEEVLSRSYILALT